MKVTPLPQSLGATVTELDLANGIDDELADRLRGAWHDNLVLFFPGLHLDDEQHMALGGLFGDLAATSQGNDDQRDHLTRGPNREILVLDAERPQDRANAWHTDVTFTATPPIGSLLAMQVCPDKGGDTIWSNQVAAYEALSPSIKVLIDDLHAVHGRPGMTGTTTHPMVTTHPATGRKALFVNRGWTSSVVGLSQVEGRHLLAMLFEHAERPEFQVRWTWAAGDAALWDNRVTMHYAVNDYGSAARILHRVTIYDR